MIPVTSARMAPPPMARTRFAGDVITTTRSLAKVTTSMQHAMLFCLLMGKNIFDYSASACQISMCPSSEASQFGFVPFQIAQAVQPNGDEPDNVTRLADGLSALSKQLSDAQVDALAQQIQAPLDNPAQLTADIRQHVGGDWNTPSLPVALTQEKTGKLMWTLLHAAANKKQKEVSDFLTAQGGDAAQQYAQMQRAIPLR